MVLQVPSQKLGFAENFMLSGSAAIISKTCAAPLERMKLLIQNQAERVKVPLGVCPSIRFLDPPPLPPPINFVHDH